MFQYTNFLSYSASPNTGEFFLTFGQQNPILKPDGTLERVNLDMVAQVVMSTTTLKALKDLLSQIDIQE